MPQLTLRERLQLSVPFRVPQFFPCRAQKAGSVSGVQTTAVHCPAALQDWLPGQAPQLPPQPSAPHCFPLQLGVQPMHWPEEVQV